MVEMFFFYSAYHLIIVHKTQKSVHSSLVPKVFIFKALGLVISISSQKNSTISLHFLHLPDPLLADFWLIRYSSR